MDCAPSRSTRLLLFVVLLTTLGPGAALAQPATFADVPPEHWAFSYVEALVDAGLTSGCAPGLYCPDQAVTRQEAAVFLVRATKGADFVPTELPFSIGDMNPQDWAYRWGQHAIDGSLVELCGVELVLFCPEAIVTRGDMAVYLLNAKYDGQPPLPQVSTARFEDVPVNAFIAPWVELLATDGITAGCTPTLFCPNAAVTRAEMAAFLVQAFNLPVP
jgi:hypothetical protein